MGFVLKQNPSGELIGASISWEEAHKRGYFNLQKRPKFNRILVEAIDDAEHNYWKHMDHLEMVKRFDLDNPIYAELQQKYNKQCWGHLV